MARKSIENAISLLQQGKMIIVVDNEHRENEGDVVFLAEKATPELVEFAVKRACGLLCVPISTQIAQRLKLSPMVSANTSTHETPFSVSVDCANGGTGISINDRTETIKTLASIKAKECNLVKPGHIFPLIAKEGGLNDREGHTEAAIELAKLCKAKQAAVICEILGKNYEMARGDELVAFSKKYNIPIISIEDLKNYIKEPQAKSILPTQKGNFDIETFASKNEYSPTVVLKAHKKVETEYIPVRIHSECFTGDVLGSKKCDCGTQLSKSLEYLSKNGGFLIYLRQEGRGIGLENKIKAYHLQDKGADTWDANVLLGREPDERKYDEAISILKHYGCSKIALLTNNPDKIAALNEGGLDTKRLSLEINPTKESFNYLKTKKNRFNHMLFEGDI